MPIRTVAYVDGFNLYHAIHDLRQDHLKWVDLWALSLNFARPPDFDLLKVYYFSAYATWLPAPWARHRAYVSALRTRGVVPLMANFKKKSRSCKRCGGSWVQHEEKESDVGLGAHLVNDAHRNLYDRALILSADSDLAAAIKLVAGEFPAKEVRIVTPPGRYDSVELVRASGHAKASRIQPIHLERSLLPAVVVDAAGVTINRPADYDP